MRFHNRASIKGALKQILIITPLMLFFMMALTATSQALSAGEIINYTNIERQKAGLPALKTDQKLISSSQQKASHMFTYNYWDHIAPDGTSPWYFFKLAGYNYKYAGENLAKGFSSDSGVIQGWMNSPGHRANILSANFTDIGISVQSGMLLGQQTTLVVAHYGAPMTPVATPAPTPKPVTSSQHTTVKPTTAQPQSTRPQPKPTQISPKTTPTRSSVRAASLQSINQKQQQQPLLLLLRLTSALSAVPPLAIFG